MWRSISRFGLFFSAMATGRNLWDLDIYNILLQSVDKRRQYNKFRFLFLWNIRGGEHPDSRYWSENCCSRFSLTNQTRFLAFWMSLEATISHPPLPNATIIQAVVATSSWIRPVATLQFGSLQCSGAISNVNEKESA